MARETEVKIKVEDVVALRKRLKAAGLRLHHKRAFEDNVLYDTPDRVLRRVRSLARLRQYGERWFIAYKGTPDPDAQFKSRVEYETEVADPAAMRAIFASLGLVPAFRYQKWRAIYSAQIRVGKRLQRAEVALDETPIGTYLELEGTRSAIDVVARLLGYSRADYSTSSYGFLYLEHCKQNGIPPGDMVFTSIRRKGKLQRRKTGASRRLGSKSKR